MQIRLTYPSDAISAETIARALEASASVAESQLDQVPSIYDAIDSGKVVWRAEPRGQGFESFDTPLQVWKRGWGDCDDLVPWLLADLRVSGDDPEARAGAYQSGEKKWHCIVERSNGSIDDPSRWAGMGQRARYRVPAERPIIAPGQSGMVVGEASSGSGLYVCRFDIAIEPEDDEGFSVRRHGESPVDAVENAAVSSFHLAVRANFDPMVIKRLWGLVLALRGYASDHISRLTGLEPHEQGQLTPLVTRVLDFADEHDVDGDGILSTIFDPLGLHHLADPLVKPLLDKAKGVKISPRGGGSSTDLSSLLTNIIGANKGRGGRGSHGSSSSRSQQQNYDDGGGYSQPSQPPWQTPWQPPTSPSSSQSYGDGYWDDDGYVDPQGQWHYWSN